MMRALVLVLVACGPIYPPAPQTSPPPPATSPPPAATEPVAPSEPVEPHAPRPPTSPASGPVALDSRGKPLPTSTGTQAEIAADRHWEGEEAYRRGDYAVATARFREAVARVPEPRYFYNLCAALFMEGKFSEALVACDAVRTNAPAADLRDKADTLIAQIQYEAQAQGITLTR